MKILFKFALLLCSSLFAVQSSAAVIGACQDEECVRYFKEYKKYAKAGYADAMATLADLYYYGHGTEANLNKALKQYRKAAKYGSPKGQYRAAMLYLNDKNVRDLGKGVKYLKQAARSHNLDAAFLLGMIYFKPNYYERDLEEADKWLTRAYEGGHMKISGFIDFMKASEGFSAGDFPELWAAIERDPSQLEAAKNAALAEAAQAARNPELTQQQREQIEVITVTSDLHDLFEAQLAGLKNTYPDKGGVNTGSMLIGRNCKKTFSCATTSISEYNNAVKNIMGQQSVRDHYIER